MYQSTFFNLLLQFALFSFAMAEETVTGQSHGNTWQYGAGGGVLGFIVLILDIIVWSTFSPIPPFPLPVFLFSHRHGGGKRN